MRSLRDVLFLHAFYRRYGTDRDPRAACRHQLYLIIQTIIPGRPNTTISLILLAIVLGLPGLLIVITSRKIACIGWMLVYLLSLPIWNFVLFLSQLHLGTGFARKRPTLGKLDLSGANAKNVTAAPVSALPLARIINDISKTSYPEDIKSPAPDSTSMLRRARSSELAEYAVRQVLINGHCQI